MIDSSIVGRELDRTTFPIERSKLAELARSFGDDDPVWYDDAAAAAAGFDAVPVPPTVTVLSAHWKPGGVPALVEQLGMDLGRVLHGEARWEYLGPVRLGDTLTARQWVADVTTREGKRGGSMTLVTLKIDFTNQHGELVTRRTDVLIEREV